MVLKRKAPSGLDITMMALLLQWMLAARCCVTDEDSRGQHAACGVLCKGLWERKETALVQLVKQRDDICVG